MRDALVYVCLFCYGLCNEYIVSVIHHVDVQLRCETINNKMREERRRSKKPANNINEKKNSPFYHLSCIANNNNKNE